MKVTYENLINNHTLNVFTDASILRDNIINGYNLSISTPGAQIYLGDILQDSLIQMLPDCTNNEGEIIAIQNGLYLAEKWRKLLPQVDNINLFSDSKISLLGLREWCYSWIKAEQNGILYGSSGEIKNQVHFIHAIYFILSHDLKINMYHTRGHINAVNFRSVAKFRNSFVKENHLNYYPDDHIINFMIKGNNKIDNDTRQYLNFNKIYIDDWVKPRPRNGELIINWHNLIKSFDMIKYQYLTGGYNKI